MLWLILASVSSLYLSAASVGVCGLPSPNIYPKSDADGEPQARSGAAVRFLPTRRVARGALRPSSRGAAGWRCGRCATVSRRGDIREFGRAFVPDASGGAVVGWALTIVGITRFLRGPAYIPSDRCSSPRLSVDGPAMTTLRPRSQCATGARLLESADFLRSVGDGWACGGSSGV